MPRRFRSFLLQPHGGLQASLDSRQQGWGEKGELFPGGWGIQKDPASCNAVCLHCPELFCSLFVSVKICFLACSCAASRLLSSARGTLSSRCAKADPVNGKVTEIETRSPNRQLISRFDLLCPAFQLIP